MTRKHITQQQKRFLNEYADTLNLEKSARAAGYRSTNVLSQVRAMLLKPAFKQELEKIISERVFCLDIPRSYIVKKYLELIEYASAADEGGMQDPALALRALDGLCKNFPGEENAPAEDVLSMRIEGLNHQKI